MSRDADRRKTIFSDTFGGVGRKNNVREQGRCAHDCCQGGPLVAICPLPCLLAQAILTRKLTNLSFLTHRMTESHYNLFAF